MDLTTIVGLVLGLVVLSLALIMGHVPINTLMNPEAFVIVFGGTITATLVAFNAQTLIHSAFALLRGGSPESRLKINTTVAYVMDVVNFVRDEGILALQPMLPGIEIPFLRKGLMLVLDNRSERYIKESLSTEIEVIYRETMDHARVYETAGGFAPTMGIIGAVIGLIFILQGFSDPVQLGKGVAGAFSATLYGVAFSNLFLLPLAGKLRHRARDEWFIRTLLLESILSIRSGEHPMLIKERLSSFGASANNSNAADEMPISPAAPREASSNDTPIAPPRRKQYASHVGKALDILPAKTVNLDDFLNVPAPPRQLAPRVTAGKAYREADA